MKFFWETVLIIALFTILYYILKSYKENHKLALTVRRTLEMGFVIVFFYIIILFSNYAGVSAFSYSVYFAASDWLLYFFLYFCIEYAGQEFTRHVKKPIMILVLFIDTVMVLLNNVFGYLFDVKNVELLGDTYYRVNAKPLFYVHYSIIIMLVIFSMTTLIYKTINSPDFYRQRYMNIAIVLAIIVVLNIVTFNWAVDLSIIGYVVEGICMYYCVFVYTPQRLLPKTLYMVAEDMTVGLFVFDIDGNKLYSNHSADQFLKADPPITNKEGFSLEEWCRKQYMFFMEEFTWDEKFYKDGEEIILNIQLQRLLDSRHQLQGGYYIVQDRTEEVKKNKEKQYLAMYDSLTGVYNKAYFFERVERYINRNSDQELIMICTDIKDFKMINDFFGTKVGDSVLVNFAKVLMEQINGAICYGRLGNDIFGILMHKDKFDETSFTDEDKNAFGKCMDNNIDFKLVTYIGVYEITERNLPVSVMCDRARVAISSIKGDYNKRVAYYDNVLRDNTIHEKEIIRDLDRAIEEEQLKMYLQPQVTSDGKLVGAEALIRWAHPVKGMIMPGKFISIFENNGLISVVDKYIWEKACVQLSKWKKAGREDISISVNISPRDFYFLDIYDIFVGLINKYEIKPENLKLEITETAVVMDIERQMELIGRLREKGFVVEIDDFGSGYSSLNMLKDIFVDIVKIDMVFLRKARNEERSKQILSMIINLSKQLGMPVIMEGVETKEQLDYLADMGCDMFQGYYFAKPMPVEEFEINYLNVNF